MWSFFWVLLGVLLLVGNHFYQEHLENEIDKNLVIAQGRVRNVYRNRAHVYVEYEYTVNGHKHYGTASTDKRFRGCEATNRCRGMLVKVKYSKRNPDISDLIHEDRFYNIDTVFINSYNRQNR